MSSIGKQNLLSERFALTRMIAETPPEDVIDLGSLKARLEAVDRQLGSFVETCSPVKAQLTFRGRPVVGSHGIFAEFGMTATKLFADAVVSVAASLETRLAATGPIPNRNQYQLLITDKVTGSFGFELQEHRESSLPLEEESPVAEALKQVQELMRGAAGGSDDELADIASGQSHRAMTAMREFLKELADSEAVCALAVEGRTFGFSDVGEVQRSLARLEQGNFFEESRPFDGFFQGVLPRQRTFEFADDDTGEVISGKIGAVIDDPGIINAHLNQRVRIWLTVTRVGQGRPRYALGQMPSWPLSRGDSN